MSIIKGKTNTVAGVGKNGTGFTLFTSIWQDHLVNNASWLRADTFSWQSGAVYVAAYNHLVNDFNGTTSATETIGSTTITYYRSEDGHKIVLPDQENNVMSIYNATGIAWYYILDTTNQRFKLPRNKYGFRGLETTVGSYFQGSVPAHKHQLVSVKEDGTGTNGGTNGFINAASTSTERVATNTDVSYAGNIVNATEYQDGAAVKSRSVEMYLYFFVGNTVEEVTTINVGQLTESLNGKADTSLGNLSATGKSLASGLGMPSNRYIDLTLGASGSTYTAPANGWVFFSKVSTAAGQWIQIVARQSYHQILAVTVNPINFLYPVIKNETFAINYTAAGTTEKFRFIYAEGDK